ncbi:MAG: hypothetical protein ACJ75J_00605, partial [Cytophagaceae bacterium]
MTFFNAFAQDNANAVDEQKSVNYNTELNADLQPCDSTDLSTTACLTPEGKVIIPNTGDERSSVYKDDKAKVKYYDESKLKTKE